MLLAQNIPQEVLQTMQLIEQSGHQAYLVGGCVRDTFIHRVPHDWDICTDAMPGTISTLFPHTILTGMKHGTVTVMMQKTPIEVTTWRTETTYTDRRRPDTVNFTNSLIEDLSRRDFTINAMAWNPTEGLVDPFHGASDLEKCLLRCVGDPTVRFDEDALRMLRAIRFCSELDFSLDEQTRNAIVLHAHHIAFISRERVLQEFRRILLGKNPAWLALIWQSGLSNDVLPLSEPDTKLYDILKHMHDMQLREPFFWAALFANEPTRQLKLMATLRTENKLQTSVKQILDYLPYAMTVSIRNRRFCFNGASKDAEGILQLAKLLKPDTTSIESTRVSKHVAPPARNEQCSTQMAIRGQYLSQIHHLKGKAISDTLTLLSLIWCERPELFDGDIPDWLIQEIIHKTSGLPSK